MAEIALKGKMKVKTLKADFKKAFGCTLRVYMSESCKGRFADDEATLASIRAEGKKGGELTIRGNMQIGNFEKKIAEMYGIGVQVANTDDTALLDNDMTISAATKQQKSILANNVENNQSTIKKSSREKKEKDLKTEFENLGLNQDHFMNNFITIDQSEKIKRLAKIGIVFCALEDEGSIDTKVVQTIIKKATEYGYNQAHLQTIFNNTLHELLEGEDVDLVKIVEDVASNIENEQEANQILEICSVMLQVINGLSCIPMIRKFGEVGNMLGLDASKAAAFATNALHSYAQAKEIAKHERIARLGFVLCCAPGFDNDTYGDDDYYLAICHHADGLGLDGELIWQKRIETKEYVQSEIKKDDDIINTILNEVLQNVEDTEEAHQLLEVCSEIFFFLKSDAINEIAGYFLEFAKRINLSKEEVDEIIQTAINTRKDNK